MMKWIYLQILGCLLMAGSVILKATDIFDGLAALGLLGVGILLAAAGDYMENR